MVTGTKEKSSKEKAPKEDIKKPYKTLKMTPHGGVPVSKSSVVTGTSNPVLTFT